MVTLGRIIFHNRGTEEPRLRGHQNRIPVTDRSPNSHRFTAGILDPVRTIDLFPVPVYQRVQLLRGYEAFQKSAIR